MCHFVDTCLAIAGAPVTQAHIVGSGRGEALLNDNLAIILGFENASVATIVYAPNGHARMSKERIEILGSGNSVVIDDFKRLIVNGKEIANNGQDKGHSAEVSAFLTAITSNEPSLPDFIGTSRLMLSLAAQLGFLSSNVEPVR